MKPQIFRLALSAAVLVLAKAGTVVAELPTNGTTTSLPAAAKSAHAGRTGAIKLQLLSMSPTILDPTRDQITNLTFTPKKFMLVDEKPAGIIKEPVYMGKPKYGAFQIGNGSRSITYFAIDEVEGKDGKIYVDTNQDGDLTNDGAGNWDILKDGAGHLSYNKFVNVHASWGSPVTEVESATYRLLVAHTPGQSFGGYAKVSARVGEIKLAEKTFPVILAENSNDGIFTVPADGDLTRNPVWLFVDTTNDKPIIDNPAKVPFDEQRQMVRFNIAHPFKIDQLWYLARPSLSGATLSLVEVPPPNESAAKPSTAPALESLQVGTDAPNFTALTPEGKDMRLADYKGKVVILDFWATWCGPCQAAMPGLEKFYQTIKDQDVVVLSINVLDERDAFDRWIKMNAGTRYHFNFGYDPAGKSDDESIAVSKYKLFSIPHVFVISRGGKIAATMTGGDEAELRTALQTQGITAK